MAVHLVQHYVTNDQLFSRFYKGKKKWALVNVRESKCESDERYKNILGSKIN